jgi:hypothetical protein
VYSSKPAYVFGFHGLDKNVGKAVLNGKTELRHSTNPYDWLGHGVYFWENSYERAKQYADEDSQRKHSKIKTPFVIGSIIDLGNCLDLLDKQHLDFLAFAYHEMVQGLNEAGTELPTNSPFGVNDFDFKKRELDCAVIRYAIDIAKLNGIKFDSVRAAFGKVMNFTQTRVSKRIITFNFASSILIASKGYFYPVKNKPQKKKLINHCDIVFQTIPISRQLPNKETQSAMLDIRAGKNLKFISLEQFRSEFFL